MNTLIIKNLASIMVELRQLHGHEPCEIDRGNFQNPIKIIKFVFDPLEIESINDHYIKLGFLLRNTDRVVAESEGESILVWGGVNSIYCIKKGEKVSGIISKQLLYDDSSDLIRQFKIKKSRNDVQELIIKLKEKYNNMSAQQG